MTTVLSAVTLTSVVICAMYGRRRPLLLATDALSATDIAIKSCFSAVDKMCCFLGATLSVELTALNKHPSRGYYHLVHISQLS